MPDRYVTDENEQPTPEPRYRLYRLCECEACSGSGKDAADNSRCPLCRGEGRVRERVAEAETPENLGAALVTVALEGQLDGCAIGILDTQGDPGKKWLIKPWLPSPRNVSDAGRVLASAPRKERA
jgi:hypothetical protein